MDYVTISNSGIVWLRLSIIGAAPTELTATGVFTPALEKIREKVSGGNEKWLIALSGACSLGIFGYLNENEIVKGWGNAAASVTGAISMVLFIKLLVPKFPKLREYTLGMPMIVGMACAAMALEATDSKPGTLKAEVASTMAICGSIITNLFFTTLEALVGSAVVALHFYRLWQGQVL